MRTVRTVVCGLVWLTVSHAAHAYGPNLVLNSGFESSLVSWGNTGGATWAATDQLGNPGSGSAYLSFVGSGLGGTYGPSQCVNVTAGTSYVAHLDGWIPSGNDPAVKLSITGLFHGASGCGGPPLGVFLDQVPGQRNSWDRLDVVRVAPAGAVSVNLYFGFAAPNGASVTGHIDNAFLVTGKCAPSATNLCLNKGRFRVSVAWSTPAPSSGSGQAVPFADESGSFWFFSPTNLELDVKVLDGCGLNGRYWVFIAGLTNVHATITVLDTQTGASRTYDNPQDHVFTTVTDTGAFSTCP